MSSTYLQQGGKVIKNKIGLKKKTCNENDINNDHSFIFSVMIGRKRRRRERGGGGEGEFSMCK